MPSKNRREHFKHIFLPFFFPADSSNGNSSRSAASGKVSNAKKAAAPFFRSDRPFQSTPTRFGELFIQFDEFLQMLEARFRGLLVSVEQHFRAFRELAGERGVARFVVQEVLIRSVAFF